MQVELNVPEPREVFIDPADSALVIVEMQNFSLKREASPIYERAQPTIPATALLLEQFRATGSKVIHVQSLRKPDALEFTAFGREPYLLEDTWESEIIDELAPIAGEPVVKKWSHDSFNNTTMEAILDVMDLRPCRTQIVVAGVTTNVGYDCTVTGFRVRGFMVYLPIDATASATLPEELLAFHHLVGGPARPQYNTVATRSDMVTLDAERISSDPLAGKITRGTAILDDPLYKAITTLTIAA